MPYRFDNFEFDDASFRLLRAGESVPLEPKGLRLLLYLLENPNRLVRKQELLDYVWPETNVGENALNRAVGLLRRALDDDIRAPRFIQTVPTLGYRFIAPVTAAGAARPEITAPGVSRTGGSGFAIQSGSEPAKAAERPAKGRSLIGWIAVITFAFAFGALAFVHFRQAPPTRQRVQFQINPPSGGELDEFKLSPDGRFLAMNTGEQSTSNKIWIRSLDSLDTRLLTDIEGFVGVSLFWSRDGESIAYFSGSKLYKIPRRGGPAVLVTEAPQWGTGGVWLDSGVIVFGTRNGLYRVPSSGGTPVKINDHSSESPAWLPGEHFLYTRPDGVFVGSLDGAKPAQILPDHTAVTYVPSPVRGKAGHLLFVRGETLMALAFDVDRLQPQGDPIVVQASGSNLFRESENGNLFTTSENGVLVFGQQSANVVLTWLDRTGKRIRSLSPSFRMFPDPAIQLSPDDSKAIVTVDGANGADLWIADLDHEKLSRFTFAGSYSGIWSPDGKKILWAARDGNRYLRSADGSGTDELLFRNPNCPDCYSFEWSPDGKLIAICISKKPGLNIWMVPTVGDRKPFAYIESNFSTYWAQFSPDSRWLAYVSEQAPQRQQVFIESVPRGRGRWQVSTEGGDWPMWRRDGKELFYIQGAMIMAVPIRLTKNSIEIGKTQALFEEGDTGEADGRFQVSRDGQRFLMALPAEASSALMPLTVDTDWQALTK